MKNEDNMVDMSIAKIRPVLKKALTFNLKPTEESFPELPTVLIWFRFFLGIAYGIFVGSQLRHSVVGLLQSLNILTFVPVMYCKLYLGVDSNVFSNQLIFCGLHNAVALSLLIWIYFFTAAHEAQENQLTALLLTTAIQPDVGDSYASATPTEDSEAFDSTVVGKEETVNIGAEHSEF